MALTPIRILIVGENKAGKAFDDAAQASSRFGVAVDGVGSLAVRSFGLIGGAAGAAAVAVKGISEAFSQEALSDKLAAQLGATPEMAADFGRIAGNLYADAYGESIAEVNEALRQVQQNGLLPEDATNEQIESLTASVIDFATAMDQDLGGTARAVGQMIRTGLVENADQAMDILTRGFQQGVNKADDLLDTINEYGTQFRQLGLSGYEAMGLLSQGLKAGARDADTVADALKEFAIRAQDGSKLTADGFRQLGLNGSQMGADIARGGLSATNALDATLDKLRGIQDPAKRAQIAVALFGTKAEDLQDALDDLDVSTSVDALGNVEGAAKRMGETLNDNAKTKLEAFKRTATQNLVNFLGDEVIPALEAVGESAGPALSKVGSAVSDFLAGNTASAGVTIGTLLGFDEDSEETDRIIDTLDTIKAIIEDVTGFVTDKAGEVRDFIQEVMPQIRDAISAVTEEIRTIWNLVGDDILSAADRVWNTIKGIIGGQLEIIQGTITLVLALISGDWGKAWDGIKQILGGVWDVIFAIVAGALGVVKSIIGAGLSYVANLFSSVWNSITEHVIGAWKSQQEFISSAIEWFKGLPGRITSAVSGLWDGIKESFRSALNWIIEKWNGFSLRIPEIDTHIPGVGKVGGFTLDTPNIPTFAAGGIAKGLAIVGEQGPELIHVGQPSRVYSHRDSLAIAAKPSITFAPNISIDARGSNVSEARIRQIVEQVIADVQKEFVMELEARRVS